MTILKTCTNNICCDSNRKWKLRLARFSSGKFYWCISMTFTVQVGVFFATLYRSNDSVYAISLAFVKRDQWLISGTRRTQVLCRHDNWWFTNEILPLRHFNTTHWKIHVKNNTTAKEVMNTYTHNTAT